MIQNNHEIKLKPYVSPLNAWAMSLGTSIGWGSLVVTSSTYLSNAGPLGSVLGMVIGALIMLVIARSYHYLMNRYPDAGGAYTYTKRAFGYDFGFVTSWFLSLTYFSMLWANATSLPLFARYFWGDIFRFGKLYTIFDYDIYLGEVLLSVAAIILISLLCVKTRRGTIWALTGMVILFTAAITICFAAAIFGLDIGITPAFQPGGNELMQVFHITFISTWAFIGFENISHAAEEFTFPHRRGMRIMRISVITTALLYIFITLLSVTAYPPQFSSWTEYIANLGSLEGIDGLPAFYAAQHYLGDLGVWLLMLALLALVLTSLIGNILALSRLFYVLAKDKILPGAMSVPGKHGVPWKIIVLIAGVSCLAAFAGRSAIGWVVDVTTIGATMIYGFVAAAAMKTAKDMGEKGAMRFGLIGVVLMAVFGLYILVPNLFMEGSLENESYFLFVLWSVLGLFVFRFVIKRDEFNRFGHSLIVWVALLAMSLFVSLVWMSQSNMDAAAHAIKNVSGYIGSGDTAAGEAAAAQEYGFIRYTNSVTIAVVAGLFVISAALMVNNYAVMLRRIKKSEAALGEVKSVAFTDPLTHVKSKHAYVSAEEGIDLSIEAGDVEEFAIVVCDVNGLKKVNDSYGHKAGDKLIQDAAKVICTVYKHSPVYRIGGDEFVALLRGHDYQHREELYHTMMERNRQDVSGGVIIACGMAEYEPDSDNSVAPVFERADIKMYENKKSLKDAAL